jgi:hypothetical protein
MAGKKGRETTREENAQIEYEQVSIQLPRVVMKLLRDSEKTLGMSPQEYLECSVIRVVRADLDVGDVFNAGVKQTLKEYGLNSVFKAVINDPVTY